MILLPLVLLVGARSTRAADPPASPGVVVEEALTAPPVLLTPLEPIWPPGAPPEARGVVVLELTVAPDGAVIGVEVMEGPELFRASAIATAQALRFQPSTHGSAPVQGRARLQLVFEGPPAPVEQAPGAEELVVTAEDPDRVDPRARTTLGAAELERAAGGDLAETVSSVPGVVRAGGTGDTAKPIIRGHQERRLLVLVDGIRHEGQKWGPDHATEVDPFSAGEITVVRGAAGARYGPDAIGGVILVEPPALRTAPGVDGRTLAVFSSDGLRGYGAARVDAVPRSAPALTFRLEGNYGRGGSLSAPDYVLGNTASEQWNAGGALALRGAATTLRVTVHRHALRAGVFYGVRNSTVEEFEANLASEVPVTAHLWERSWTIDRPFQAVQHDMAALHFAAALPEGGALTASYAFQRNLREEYEQVRESVSGAQYDFTLRTHSIDLLYHAPERDLLGGGLAGGIGAQGIFQENVYRGLPLIPNFRAFGGGIFAFQRLSLARGELELGLRYDLLGRVAFFEESELERHLRRGTLDEERCLDAGELAACAARYGAASASAGFRTPLVPELLELKGELSSASRFPNVDELYLIGTAPTYPVYALGAPDLPVERSWGGSSTLGAELAWVRAEGSVFGSFVQDYVYFAPELNADGSPHYDVTIRGTWPTYAFRPIDAWVYGADGRIELGPDATLGLEALASLVRGQRAGSLEHLVGIPPDRARLSAVLRPGSRGPLREPRARVGVELVARQSRVDPEADFAPPPEGYALLDASVETTLQLRRRALRLGFEASNLLDTAYREYTSLLRYYADQPGRDLRLRVAVDL